MFAAQKFLHQNFLAHLKMLEAAAAEMGNPALGSLWMVHATKRLLPVPILSKNRRAYRVPVIIAKAGLIWSYRERELKVADAIDGRWYYGPATDIRRASCPIGLLYRDPIRATRDLTTWMTENIERADREVEVPAFGSACPRDY